MITNLNCKKLENPSKFFHSHASYCENIVLTSGMVSRKDEKTGINIGVKVIENSLIFLTPAGGMLSISLIPTRCVPRKPSHEKSIQRSFERGLSVAEVALISGHKDPRMLFRYVQLRPEDIAHKLGDWVPCHQK